MNTFSGNDPTVVATQYSTSANLDARIRLHAGFSTNHYGWLPWVFDQLLALPPTATLLEIGCGTGQLWTANGARIPAGWTLILSDQSPGMLDTAAAALKPLPRPLLFEQIDAQQIPYADGYFDAVIANHMLYHVPDLPKAISEIHRVLKPGGHLFAGTNGKAHMVGLGELAGRFDPALNIKSFLAIDNFQLENGGDKLAQFFPHIECRLYEDALVVDQPTPLVDYILSMAPHARFTEQRTALHEFVVQALAAQGGAIRIEKATGLFIATK